MTNARVAKRKVGRFLRMWGLPIAVGVGVGLGFTALAMPPLAERYGAVAGGAMSSPAGIGLGLLVAIFIVMFSRLGARPGQLTSSPGVEVLTREEG